MATFRTFVASLLALTMIVGAPVAAWAGATASAECAASGGLERCQGCCGDGAAMSDCGMVCASSFTATITTAADGRVSASTTVPPQIDMGRQASFVLPPDTAPPKRFSA